MEAAKSVESKGATEYLWLHAPTMELMALWAKPTPRREDYPHDLEIDGRLLLTDLYYIGEV